MKNYFEDKNGALCLEAAAQSKSSFGYGAIVLEKDKIIGRGFDRRVLEHEKNIKPCTKDGIIHAERAALIDAGELLGAHSSMYVVGRALQGNFKNAVIVNPKLEVRCRLCAESLGRNGISLNIAAPNGWGKLTPRSIESKYVSCPSRHVLLRGEIIGTSSVWGIGDLDIYYGNFAGSPQGRIFVSIDVPSIGVVSFHANRDSCICAKDKGRNSCRNIKHFSGTPVDVCLNIDRDFSYVLFVPEGLKDVIPPKVWYMCSQHEII